MTIDELRTLLDDAEAAGATGETEVLIAIQPEYPLVSHLAGGAFVDAGDERSERLVLCEGVQRREMPYLTDAESEAIAEQTSGTAWDNLQFRD